MVCAYDEFHEKINSYTLVYIFKFFFAVNFLTLYHFKIMKYTWNKRRGCFYKTLQRNDGRFQQNIKVVIG